MDKINKILNIIGICLSIFWIGFIGDMVFNDLRNNSQEAVGIPITITTSSEEYTISIPEYNKKLDYLWSKLSEKERCRFEDENKMYNVQAVADEKGVTVSRVYSGDCTKWLEKTESKYLLP